MFSKQNDERKQYLTNQEQKTLCLLNIIRTALWYSHRVYINGQLTSDLNLVNQWLLEYELIFNTNHGSSDNLIEKTIVSFGAADFERWQLHAEWTSWL